MTTQRLQVRNALKTVVGTAAGLTVHLNLDYALEDRNLPCAALQSGNDEASDEAGTLLNSSREGGTAKFAVCVLVAESADPEAAADSYEALIRAAILSNPTLSGKAVHTHYRSGEWEFDLGDCALRRLIFQTIF